MSGPRILTAYDTQGDAVTTVALADVAADIRRYELLGSADSGTASSGGNK